METIQKPKSRIYAQNKKVINREKQTNKQKKQLQLKSADENRKLQVKKD